jgi:hypothetical protein
VNPRLALAAAGVTVAAIVVAVVAVSLAGRDEEEVRPPALRGEVLSTSTSFTPQAHLFGERVQSRLDILFDRARVPAETVTANPRFAPYTVVSRKVTRETLGAIGRVRYDFTLECVTRRCLAPRAGVFTFPQTGVEYKPVAAAVQDPLTASVDWPALRVASRIGPGDLEGLELQADIRQLPPVSYRVQPVTVTAVGYGLAVVLGLLGLALLAQALALPDLIRSALARRRARQSPLQRALNLVRRSTADGERVDSRRALERLAVELRESREPDLARTATGLAWRRREPSRPTVDPLSDDVERVITKESGQ